MTAMNTADHTKTAPPAIAFEPYIFLYGRCEEALAFYTRVFGGTFEMMRVEDTPVAASLPPERGKRVMHASFTAPGIRFMLSDGMQDQPVDGEAGNIALAISATDGPAGERLFSALAEGGTVKMPIDAAFWGGRFGICIDRFGTEWLMTLP